TRVERRSQHAARAVPSIGRGTRRRDRRVARRDARGDLPGPLRPQPSPRGGGITMRSPVVAMLWENWRLTRLEAFNRLALSLVGGAVLLVASRPDAAGAYDPGNVTTTFFVGIFIHVCLW